MPKSCSAGAIWPWIQRYGPELEARLRGHLKLTHESWRVDETCVGVQSRGRYLDRAIDSTSVTIDFVLSRCRGGQTPVPQGAVRSAASSARVIDSNRHASSARRFQAWNGKESRGAVAATGRSNT